MSILPLLLRASTAAATLGLAAVALAVPADGPYPIAELGSCRDERECALYCEIPANQLDCWYRANVTRPRVLQAAQPAETVTINGQTFTYAEAADHCADPAHADACLAAARAAGITPELPPEYAQTAREIGATGEEALALVEDAMHQYRTASETERERYEALVLERLPEGNCRASRYVYLLSICRLGRQRTGASKKIQGENLQYS